jgi:hypothetical protein
MVAVNAACENVWLRRILADLQVAQVYTTTLHCDKQGVHKLAKNLIFHDHTKHVEVHCPFIQLLEENK